LHDPWRITKRVAIVVSAFVEPLGLSAIPALQVVSFDTPGLVGPPAASPGVIERFS